MSPCMIYRPQFKYVTPPGFRDVPHEYFMNVFSAGVAAGVTSDWTPFQLDDDGLPEVQGMTGFVGLNKHVLWFALLLYPTLAATGLYEGFGEQNLFDSDAFVFLRCCTHFPKQGFGLPDFRVVPLPGRVRAHEKPVVIADFGKVRFQKFDPRSTPGFNSKREMVESWQPQLGAVIRVLFAAFGENPAPVEVLHDYFSERGSGVRRSLIVQDVRHVDCRHFWVKDQPVNDGLLSQIQGLISGRSSRIVAFLQQSVRIVMHRSATSRGHGAGARVVSGAGSSISYTWKEITA